MVSLYAPYESDQEEDALVVNVASEEGDNLKGRPEGIHTL
jgi:hypothetical protein